MKVIDLHCDTVSELYLHPQESFASNSFAVDLKKLHQGDYLVQNFALFTDRSKTQDPKHHALALYDRFCQMMAEHDDEIAQARTYADIKQNAAAGKISAVLTLEDGGVVDHDLGMLQNWYQMGVRMIALTWNYPNEIGYPQRMIGQASDFHRSVKQVIDEQHGLTDFGIEYVRTMEELGILIDVSHLSDAGFWDVMHYSRGPIVASHSNARALCPAARNLSDEMIRSIAQRGGLIGINFCGDFLEQQTIENGPSRIEAIVRQILYIRNLAGIDCLALGTDFDGIDCQREIEDASQIGKLAEALKKAGMPDDEIEKIYYRNALRLARQMF